MPEKLRFLLVASTDGSVLNQALQNEFFKGHVHSLAVDRQCGAIEKAKAHGLHVEEILENSARSFCTRLHEYADKNKIDYVFSFYTQFYHAVFRNSYRDKIVNFHPSILPAFKGMDGFGDQVAYDVKFIGATVEFIDQVMDEGKIILQHVFPYDPSLPQACLRHRLFEQQCKSILQVAKWLTERRIRVIDRNVTVESSQYDDSEFSPGLDFSNAIDLEVPFNER